MSIGSRSAREDFAVLLGREPRPPWHFHIILALATLASFVFLFWSREEYANLVYLFCIIPLRISDDLFLLSIAAVVFGAAPAILLGCMIIWVGHIRSFAVPFLRERDVAKMFLVLEVAISRSRSYFRKKPGADYTGDNDAVRVSHLERDLELAHRAVSLIIERRKFWRTWHSIVSFSMGVASSLVAQAIGSIGR